MNIGITLLYSLTEGNDIFGVLKSYVIECSDKYSVIDTAYIKADEQIKLYYPNYKFLGIEDVFTVTGKIAEGELMGRSTLYDLNNISKARELIKEPCDFSAEAKSITNYFCSSLIYFYEGKNRKCDSYTFTVLIMVKGEKIEDAFTKLKNIAKSEKILSKIVEISMDSLHIKKIRFVGIEDIYRVEEDIEKGGSFQVLFNEDSQTEKELLSILPSRDELNDIISDVFINPQNAIL